MAPGTMRDRWAALRRRRTPPDARPPHTPEGPPRAAPTPPSRFDVPALRPKADAERPVLLVLLVGLDAAAVEPYLERLDAERQAGAALPILVTDLLDLAPFRARRLPVEYLPDPARQRRFAPDLDPGLYRLRRLHLWRRKWQPVRVLAFGPAARDLLARWRGSPFEEGDPAPELHVR
ncbi:MAG: hypothetical protein KDG89_18065 [Geminicoccaceae bacterium]|nr:hypothetical protein [Geminicoccaceae bacterium]